MGRVNTFLATKPHILELKFNLCTKIPPYLISKSLANTTIRGKGHCDDCTDKRRDFYGFRYHFFHLLEQIQQLFSQDEQQYNILDTIFTSLSIIIQAESTLLKLRLWHRTISNSFCTKCEQGHQVGKMEDLNSIWIDMEREISQQREMLIPEHTKYDNDDCKKCRQTIQNHQKSYSEKFILLYDSCKINDLTIKTLYSQNLNKQQQLEQLTKSISTFIDWKEAERLATLRDIEKFELGVTCNNNTESKKALTRRVTLYGSWVLTTSTDWGEKELGTKITSAIETSKSRSH